MALSDLYKTSKKLETKGIFVAADKTRILSARSGGGNTKFLAAMTKLIQANQRLADAGAVNEAKFRKELVGVFAEHVVLGWETNVGDEENPDWQEGIEPIGFTGDTITAGELMPVTHDNVVAKFTELGDFFDWYKSQTDSLSNFKEALIRDVAGN